MQVLVEARSVDQIQDVAKRLGVDGATAQRLAEAARTFQENARENNRVVGAYSMAAGAFGLNDEFFEEKFANAPPAETEEQIQKRREDVMSTVVTEWLSGTDRQLRSQRTTADEIFHFPKPEEFYSIAAVAYIQPQGEDQKVTVQTRGQNYVKLYQLCQICSLPREPNS